MSHAELTLGYISYLNCIPFFHYLTDEGFKGRLVKGVPSVLNRMLQQGELDASPSSSFEYALNAGDYCLLPELSISSIGPVQSVLLFSPQPPEKLAGETIYLTGESATSVNLLKVLLQEFYQLDSINSEVPEQPVEERIAAGKPGLLIGDRALAQAANVPAGISCYDLGQLWYQQTGLPFVFALWIVRRDSARVKAAQIATVQQQLQASLARAQKNLLTVARENGNQCGEASFCRDYWQIIDYRLTPEHLQGLELFFSLCHKYQLLADLPEIKFFPLST